MLYQLWAIKDVVAFKKFPWDLNYMIIDRNINIYWKTKHIFRTVDMNTMIRIEDPEIDKAEAEFEKLLSGSSEWLADILYSIL